MPDNVRDAGFKPGGRKVPQKTYRPGDGVRVKRCGKSAPPRQQCRGQGKPHTEQDQIGRKFAALLLWKQGRAHVPARCVKPSGRSLEPGSNARPRGMAVAQEQSCGQNSAYRSGCHKLSGRQSLTKSPGIHCDGGVGPALDWALRNRVGRYSSTRRFGRVKDGLPNACTETQNADKNAAFPRSLV